MRATRACMHSRWCMSHLRQLFNYITINADWSKKLYETRLNEVKRKNRSSQKFLPHALGRKIHELFMRIKQLKHNFLCRFSLFTTDSVKHNTIIFHHYLWQLCQNKRPTTDFEGFCMHALTCEVVQNIFKCMFGRWLNYNLSWAYILFIHTFYRPTTIPHTIHAFGRTCNL